MRADIIEATNDSYLGDNFLKLYKKSVIFNKNISKEMCKDIIGTYKRAANIINQESKNEKSKIMGQP